MLLQSGQGYTGAPFPGTEFVQKTALLTLADGQQIAFGEIVCRDVTQLSDAPSWVGNAPAGYTPQPDMVVEAHNANAGKPYGVLVGCAPDQQSNAVAVENAAAGAPTDQVGIKNTSGQTQTYLITVQCYGYAQVWCKSVNGGNAVNVGSNLIANPTASNDAVEGAFTGLKQIGTALATVVAGSLVSGVGDALIAVPGAGSSWALLNVDLQLV